MSSSICFTKVGDHHGKPKFCRLAQHCNNGDQMLLMGIDRQILWRKKADQKISVKDQCCQQHCVQLLQVL